MTVPPVVKRPAGQAGWPVAVVAAIVAVNLPGITHIVDLNPLGTAGSMATHVAPGFITGSWFKDPDVGWITQAVGHRAALDWASGHVPWWNPYEGVGSPLAGEMQSAAFFPPVLLMLLGDGPLWFHLLLEVVAGLATWALLRELSISHPVAAVGGIAFGVNGTFAWLWHAPANPVCLLPLALLGVERGYRRPSSHSGWVLLALALALSVVAGFPEVTYLDTLLVLAWAALRTGQAERGRRARLALRYGLGVATGLLLSAPLLVAFLEYLPDAFTGGHAGSIGYLHLGAAELPYLGLPYLYGPLSSFLSHGTPSAYWTFAGGYLTAACMVLALVGLAGARRERGLRLMLTVFTAVVMLWVFGVPPFDKLTTALPYVRHVSSLTYAAPVWELAAIVLACFGLEALGRDRRARTAALAAGGVVLGFGVLMLVGTPGRLERGLAHAVPAAAPWAVVTATWEGGMVLAVTVLAALAGRRGTRLAVGLLLSIDVGATAMLPQLSATRGATVDTAPIEFLAAHLKLDRYYSFRVYHGDYGAYFGVASIDSTDDPVPKPWVKEVAGQLAPGMAAYKFDGRLVKPGYPPAEAEALAHLAAYEAIGVKYFVEDDAAPLFGPGPSYADGLRAVFHDQLVTILQLPAPAPYFRSVAPSSCSLRYSGRDSVSVDCASPATLVRDELYLPGWAATVNGRPATLSSYEGLVTAVKVPAGRSTVRFAFTPPGETPALAAFLLGLLVLVGVPAAGTARRRRSAETMTHDVEGQEVRV